MHINQVLGLVLGLESYALGLKPLQLPQSKLIMTFACVCFTLISIPIKPAAQHLKQN